MNALNSVTGAGQNTAVGYYALYGVTTGINNVAIGNAAGQNITSGSNNVVIGGYSGSGAPISGTGNNYIVLSDGGGVVRMIIDGSGAMTGNGTISDSIGNVRSIPVNDQVAAYSLASTDNGKVVSITTGGVTVNGALLTTGFTCAIFNNSASTQTITVGTGATMYLSGSTSANRTLAARGVCSLLMVASNTFVISGSLT